MSLNRTPDHQYPIMERRSRPPMLKDFLTAADDHHQLPSTTRSSTISALLHAALNSLKSPVLTLSKKKHPPPKNQLTLTIKDIIRWRSFRDLSEDESPPLVFDSSSSSSTATTTPCSSSGSSWCDSDFTAEELPCCWEGSNSNSRDDNNKKKKKFYGSVGVVKEVEMRRKSGVNSKVGPEEEVGFEFEDEQQQLSPISVLDVEYEENESAPTRLNQNLAKSERSKEKKVVAPKWEVVGLNLENLMAEEEEEEEEEEEKEDSEMERMMAMQLVEHVKATTSSVAGFHHNLLLGFFTEALISRSSNEVGYGELNEMIEEAESWINGQQQGKWSCPDLGLEDRSSGSWIKFREDQQEEIVGIETRITNLLVDEFLHDLFFSLQ